MISSYRQRGWATIRIHPNDKTPIGAWSKRIDEPEDFLEGENVGVRLGDVSGGLVDVDLDCAEALPLAPLFLPPTATFGHEAKPKSHWLYICPGQKHRKPPRAHIELRGNGQQTVFPPSIHKSGKPIMWTDPEIEVATIAEADLLAAFGKLAAATIIARAWPSLKGDRHDVVLALAGALWREGWTVDDALDLLLPAFGDDSDAHPHREQAIRDTWDETDRNRFGWPTVDKLLPLDGPAIAKMVRRGSPAAPPPRSEDGEYSFTDLGNAYRFADQHGNDLRYVPGMRWMIWDGARFVPAGEPVEAFAQTARQLQKQNSPDARKWGMTSENAPRIRAAIALAKDLDRLQNDPHELDADPWLLCCENGTVDLRSGELQPHQREDLITKSTRLPYSPGADCPRFRTFLGEIFCGDWELAAYVLRFLGYGLTGSTREQMFSLWHGHGSNGKSTLIKIIRYVLGDYAQILSGDMLIERRSGRASETASPDVARLRGTRFAAGEETKDGQRWNESLVKQLTGGGRIVARHLYGEPIEFEPTWKLVLAVNHRPVVRGTDFGMWRRIHLVPFEAEFANEKADHGLDDKLRAEAPGILALLVKACLEWQEQGLKPPQKVLDATQSYRRSQDVVGAFLDECCEATGECPMSQMYQTYRNWADKSGEYRHGKHSFNNQLRERGFEERKLHGRMVWDGLQVRKGGLG